MKKTILVIAIILCIAKLNAQGNIQIITPIISHCLIHINDDGGTSYNNANITGLSLKLQTFLKKRIGDCIHQ